MLVRRWSGYFLKEFLVILIILVCGNIPIKKETGWFGQRCLSAFYISGMKEVLAEEQNKSRLKIGPDTSSSKNPLTVQFIDNPFPLQEREKPFHPDGASAGKLAEAKRIQQPGLNGSNSLNRSNDHDGFASYPSYSSSSVSPTDARNPIVREEVNVSRNPPGTKDETGRDAQGQKGMTSPIPYGARELRQPPVLNKRGNAQDGRLGEAKRTQQGRQPPYRGMPADSKIKASSSPSRSPQKSLEKSPRRSGGAQPKKQIKSKKDEQLWGTATSQKPDKKFATDRIIVKFKKKVTESSINTTLSKVGVQVKKKLKRTGISILEVTDKEKSIKDIIEELNKSSIVEYAEPDYVIHIDNAPVPNASPSPAATPKTSSKNEWNSKDGFTSLNPNSTLAGSGLQPESLEAL